MLLEKKKHGPFVPFGTKVTDPPVNPLTTPTHPIPSKHKLVHFHSIETTVCV